MSAEFIPSRPRRRRSQAAFTIPEVVFTALVLALAITSAFVTVRRGLAQLDTARNLTVTGSILQCEMEKERLMGWSELNDAAYRPVIDNAFLRDPRIASRFTLSRTLAVLPDRGNQMVEVTLTVTWRTYDGRSLSRAYLTYFCEAGLYNYIYKNV